MVDTNNRSSWFNLGENCFKVRFTPKSVKTQQIKKNKLNIYVTHIFFFHFSFIFQTPNNIVDLGQDDFLGWLSTWSWLYS